jgi:hypothetical protein
MAITSKVKGNFRKEIQRFLDTLSEFAEFSYGEHPGRMHIIPKKLRPEDNVKVNGIQKKYVYAHMTVKRAIAPGEYDTLWFSNKSNPNKSRAEHESSVWEVYNNLSTPFRRDTSHNGNKTICRKQLISKDVDAVLDVLKKYLL